MIHGLPISWTNGASRKVRGTSKWCSPRFPFQPAQGRSENRGLHVGGVLVLGSLSETKGQNRHCWASFTKTTARSTRVVVLGFPSKQPPKGDRGSHRCFAFHGSVFFRPPRSKVLSLMSVSLKSNQRVPSKEDKST